MTSHFDPTGLIAGDYPLVHEPVTIAAGQMLKRGAVLGRVTAEGDYVLSAAEAKDGSEIPAAILAEDIDTRAGGKQAPVYFSGEFAAELCTYGEGHDADSVNAAFRKQAAPLFLRKLGAVA